MRGHQSKNYPFKMAANGISPMDTEMTDMPGQPVSKAEQLKARLISRAPMMAATNPNALKFKGVTKAQARRFKSPLGPHIEPLVSIIYWMINKICLNEFLDSKNAYMAYFKLSLFVLSFMQLNMYIGDQEIIVSL